MNRKTGSVNLIKASAGSGKTFTLATRYISLLPTNPPGSRFSRILAITFTRAATKEMAERIIKYLKKIADNSAEPVILEALSSTDSPDETAKELLEELFRNFSSFNISTIDSLVARLFLASSYPLGYPPTIEITTNAKTLIEKAIDVVIEDISAQNPLQIKNLVHSLIHGLEIRSFDLYTNIVDTFKRYTEVFISKGTGKIKDIESTEKVIKEIIRAKTDLLTHIDNLKKQMPSLRTNKAPFKWTDSLTEENLVNASIDSLAGGIVGNAGKFFNKRSLGKLEDTSFINETQTLIDQLINSLSKLFVILVTETSLDINDIAHKILGKYYQIIKEEETIPLSTALLELGKILNDPGLVPYIFMHFSQKMDHIMVDEFQDTSIQQWEFLYPLITESISRGGSFTAVGDPKQTIYFWRGSEKDIFTMVERELKGSSPVIETLDKNFRSRAKIIEYVNHTFDHELLSQNLSSIIAGNEEDHNAPFKKKVAKELSSALKHYTDVKQISTDEENGGYVEIIDLSKASEDQPVDIKEFARDLILKFIREEVEEKGRLKYSDIAILFRKNDDVNEYTTFLLQNSIPVRSTKGVDIREHLLVREIISLLKFLNNPLDNLSLITFLTGKICRKNCGENFFKEHIEPLMEEVSTGKSKERAFYLLFKDRNRETWEKFFSGIFSRVGFLPSSDLIWEIYETFNILEQFKEARPVLIHLLEISRQIEDRNSDINSFLDAFENTTEDDSFVVRSVESIDAVTISTYHKSKGLEWPVVILPRLSLRYKINDPAKFLIDAEGRYYKITKNYVRLFPESVLDEFVEETVTWLLGEINLFYVAATRARDELYIYTYPTIGNNIPNILYHLAFGHYKPDESGIARLGTKGKIRRKPEDEKGEKIFPVYLESIGNWQKNLIRKPPMLKEYSGEEILKLEEGTFYHKALEFIEYLSEDTQKNREIINGAVEDATAELGTIIEKGEATSKLEKFLHHPEVKKYFLPPGKVFREMEIVDEEGETYRIDRAYLDEEKIVIIDFKTTIEEEFVDDYRNQVRRYGKLVSRIYPDRKIQLKLLGILDGKIEDVS